MALPIDGVLHHAMGEAKLIFFVILNLPSPDDRLLSPGGGERCEDRHKAARSEF
jgi:hypothetical protein